MVFVEGRMLRLSRDKHVYNIPYSGKVWRMIRQTKTIQISTTIITFWLNLFVRQTFQFSPNAQNE